MPATELVKSRDKKFRLLFEEHPQPMWIFEPAEQHFLAVNPAALALYGYSQAEFESMTPANLQPEDEVTRFPDYPSMPAGAAPAVWRHRTKSGGLIDVEIAVFDIDYAGRKAHMASITDITARRHLEDQLRQAQKMETVGMLAGGVAHDFNNLLTIITGYSQLMLNSLPATDPNRHSAEQILKAGERAAALTNQLLAFSRRQTPQPKVLDLNSLVSGLSAMLHRVIGEDIELTLNLSPEVGRVRADPGQIEQVLMNLVVNARDAMSKGGTLRIETADVVVPAGSTGGAPGRMPVKPGRYAQISVIDNGKGMDKATAERLFEPFFTTKGVGKGTGLGLSTVLSIVKRSGGSIDVATKPSQGTWVKVLLPRVDLPLSAEPSGPPESERGTETILLVEDDEMVRKLVRETLHRSGYRIMDAAESLEARRISGGFDGRIHLLITDVVLPKVSGKELATELRAARPDMKVLYMSGYTNGAMVNSGILQEEIAFLQKPFTPSALAAKVREVLSGGGGKARRAGE